MTKNIAALLSILFLVSACDKPLEGDSTTSSTGSFDKYGCPISSSSPSTSEASYCSNIESFSDAVTITGGARYLKREISVSGLGDVGSTQNPIRHAEIAIKDSSGNVIQCGETDSSGNFSVSVPRGSTALTIEVRSRANNSNYKASILSSHNKMTYYSMTSNFTPDSTKSIGTLTTDALGSKDGDELIQLEAGAFNILDKILDANEYLRTKAASCGTDYPNIGCSNFDVAPKVQVFWKPGCNPMKYFNENAASGVSFYLSGTDRLYILGGDDGDVNYADTDHFDPVIILHEYGHFIEGQYSSSDSPGGSHDGNSIVDPRLAWSEAWASFFASAVRNVGEYVDTYGNSSGSTGFYFKYNAETNSTGSGKLDPRELTYTVPSGEGNFREMGLLRALWDMIDLDASDTDNDGVEADFQELWAIFSGSNGIKNSNYSYINAGLYFSLQSSLTDTPKTDISSILTAEKIKSTTEDYAAPVSTGSSCTISIQPANSNNENENGTLSNSNMFASNDFYRLRISSTTTTSLQLDITGGSGDLDLYLYKDDYTFGNGSDLVAYSNSSVTGASGDETISLTNLSPGDYMINVNSYTTSSTLNSNTYKLLLGGVEICP